MMIYVEGDDLEEKIYFNLLLFRVLLISNYFTKINFHKVREYEYTIDHKPNPYSDRN